MWRLMIKGQVSFTFHNFKYDGIMLEGKFLTCNIRGYYPHYSLIVHLRIIFNKLFTRILDAIFHIEFHMTVYDSPLIMIKKPKANSILQTVAILLCYMLQRETTAYFCSECDYFRSNLRDSSAFNIGINDGKEFK
jgi:hypothetical protein